MVELGLGVVSVYIETHNARAPKDLRPKNTARLWTALIFSVLVIALWLLPQTYFGRYIIALYRQPMVIAITGFLVFQMVAIALYAFIYPQNRKSVRNKLMFAAFSLLSLPVLAFGLNSDLPHMFGQAGFAVQQCFGPAAVSFKSSSVPQIACLQAWNTPYAIVERRKIAEFGQKECLKQEDEKISSNLEGAIGELNTFDSKDKVLQSFRANHVPLESADGQTYFANIYTHCLDGAGYDKNAQFKVVVLASFTAGSLVRNVTVSSSNASSFNSMFAKNGVAESYKVNFENKRRVASLSDSLSGALPSSAKPGAGVIADVALSDLDLSCNTVDGMCSSDAILTGTLRNRSTQNIRSVSIAWGINRNGTCDRSATDASTISFTQDDLLRDHAQRSFSISVRASSVLGANAQSTICGSVLSVE